MIVLIVFIAILETGQFHVVLAFYVSKTKFACRLNLAAKKNKIKTRKEELVYTSTVSTKSSNYYPKRFSDNIEKKIKYDLFFIKTIDLGPYRFTVSRNFSRELEFDQPCIKLRHIIFHASLIYLLKIYFQVKYYW